MSKSNPDLDAAIAFIIERIGEEAVRSGAQLTAGEKQFLHHLPRHPTNPTVRSWPGKSYWFTPHLRDFSFERLCRLTRDAHRHDLETHPNAAMEWKFAGAVLELNEHPMAWLLNWAGMRTKSRWGGCLLVCCATLIVTLFFLGAMAISLMLRGENGLAFNTIFIVGGVALVGALAVLYIAMQKIDRWLTRRAVEQYRCTLPIGISQV